MPKLLALHDAVLRLEAAWADADDALDLTRNQLIGVHEAIGALQRQLDAVHADVAAGIARESRLELGADGLAKQRGYRSPAKLIAAAVGISTGDAARLVAVGEATAPRSDLLGARLPAKYPAVRAALDSGAIGAQAAALIVGLLDRCRVAAGAERIAEGDRMLAEAAPGVALDDLRKLIVRAEAWLDPDGVEPRADAQRSARSLTMFERNGMLHLDAKLDAETAAPIVAAVRGYVTAAFAARAEAPDPESSDVDRRTVAMIQADGLAVLCAHALGCTAERLPLAGATVVVRIGLDELESGAGSAAIDGIDQPISVAAARRMAAGGGVIPCVLGGESEILDWGREKRLFTRAQRRALVERDGGCAMCGLPPEMTKAHHIRWWKRDHGPTDLSNGVLLCETCHHRIHDNDWEIRIEGAGVAARVWFVPPGYIDVSRTPRLGGRARFDIAA
ncbi:HNH endonuclease [Microbacterium saperdae]|uniref:5-methylcytosine-specific restriction protein A n=1 Tax=Microbacterium saperdae TaxID=69368 RepID=A0A543BB95_9MICO|nr:HNH endonuclease signature motif containing protein [Microbacterium saperdae]TQL82114.1 5-methylcytosine-specific restriction protein A [Microbacterium saperdae]GGM37322.1 HNH endonuclease [Microbacterium saperdae]